MAVPTTDAERKHFTRQFCKRLQEYRNYRCHLESVELGDCETVEEAMECRECFQALAREHPREICLDSLVNVCLCDFDMYSVSRLYSALVAASPDEERALIQYTLGEAMAFHNHLEESLDLGVLRQHDVKRLLEYIDHRGANSPEKFHRILYHTRVPITFGDIPVELMDMAMEAPKGRVKPFPFTERYRLPKLCTLLELYPTMPVEGCALRALETADLPERCVLPRWIRHRSLAIWRKAHRQ